MSWELLFATAFVVGLTGAMMPGPLLTVTLAEAARRGFIAGPLIVLGHAILEGGLIIALVAGLASFLTLPKVTTVIALVGGAFLVYMGYTIIRDARRGNVDIDMAAARETGDATGAVVEEHGSSNLRLVGLGIGVSLANPYWSLWWATIGLGYIMLALQQGQLGLWSFFSGHILADLAWYGAVAGVVAAGRRLLTPPVYRGILTVCGAFLVILGGYFIIGVGIAG
ncbi:MAG: LysE family transporter [Peptococcaceae bacterium]|nr:LysE family transporter [Peptococcaceae bacterium]